MRAEEIFDIRLDIESELCVFTGKVLFWWEEQNIKLDCIYQEKETNKLMIEHSKVFSKTMNKFLLSVESNDKKTTKEDLYQMSIKKNRNVEWSDILHHSIVMPLYDAYLDISGASMPHMQDFRKKVIAAYDKSLRMEQFEDFPVPPELIEYDLLITNGMLTRGDLLNMSYSEILKYQTIRDIRERYSGQGNKSQNNQILNQNTNSVMDFTNQPHNIPAGAFNNQELQQVAKELFPEAVI